LPDSLNYHIYWLVKPFYQFPIGLIVGIVMLNELKSDDPELFVCCVELGLDVELPVVEFGDALPNPKSFPKMPDDRLNFGQVIEVLLLLPDTTGVGLRVGDVLPSDPTFGCIPPGGAPFCGRIPPEGCPPPDGNALGLTARELLLSSDTDTSAESFSSDMAVSRLMPGLAFCSWINAPE
jgi:hypothetical protein